jgi:hypothetical protein
MMFVKHKHVKIRSNFNVNFNILLQQCNCAFSWINKGLDNIK